MSERLVGWDVYRQLDQLPLFTPGAATKQFSSFDRTGGNNDGFEGTYSCLRESGDGCVIAEATGAGEVQSIWFTRDGGDVSATGNLTIELDGEIVLNADLQSVVDGELGAPFVYPLIANADQSSGGIYLKVPMPYRTSMRITTGNNPYFYHVSYRTFPDAAGVQTFNPNDDATDVLETLSAAGQADPKPAGGRNVNRESSFNLEPGESQTFAELSGSGSVTALELNLSQVISASSLVTPIEDDGRAFGAGGLSSFTVSIDSQNDGVRLIRRYDPIIRNQRANVSVDGETVAEWTPQAALGSGQFRDQTVDLPASVTAGKSTLQIVNTFVSSDFDSNEFRYTVLSNVGGIYVETELVDIGPNSPENETAHDYVIVNQFFEGVRNHVYPPTPEQEAAVADSDEALRGLRLRLSFDGYETVDAPVGEFFGSGLGEYDTRSLFFAMDTGDEGSYRSWWPMPYGEQVSATLYNGSQVAVSGDAELTVSSDRQWAVALELGQAGYFYALSEHGEVIRDNDWLFAEFEGTGKFVGVSQTMEGRISSGNTHNYLEGDERVYVDGAQTPQLHGTGTEDFYQGGWYFNRNAFSAPTNGLSAHEVRSLGCTYECDSAWRLMIGDAVPFSSSLRFGIEHGPTNNEPAVYGSTAFVYAQPSTTLTLSDSVDVGSATSEARHDYEGDGDVLTLNAIFEGDDDRLLRENGRATTDKITFEIKVVRRNQGVHLRRLSDQAEAYQTVAVYVGGTFAGTWQQPLGNTTRRWLEDTLELPSALTAKRTLTIRLVPHSDAPAWHAARY